MSITTKKGIELDWGLSLKDLVVGRIVRSATGSKLGVLYEVTCSDRYPTMSFIWEDLKVSAGGFIQWEINPHLVTADDKFFYYDAYLNMGELERISDFLNVSNHLYRTDFKDGDCQEQKEEFRELLHSKVDINI